MNQTIIVKDLVKDIKDRLTLDGRNRVFNEGKELHSEFMKEPADPEAFTREFLIDKIFSALELEKLPEKRFDIPGSHRSVDYLIKSPRGKFLVEAKPLNADLEKGKDSGVNQMKGLFKLAEVLKNYEFGVATDGLRWIFIDKNEGIVSDLRLEDHSEQIKDFLIGKERVVSPKTEEEISKKFYEWYNALLHGGRYKDHENKTRTISEADCLVSNVLGVRDLDEREQIAQVVTNRLIFIKFLQSKGIIGEDILKYLSEVKEEDLTSKLRELFFDTMNTPVNDRFDIDERFRSIPYLNGSLFVRTEVERKNLDYKIKAEILKKVIKFLDSFKFVHKEHLENGDSIDPEILGYIFERAMTAMDRKGSGAYYTPKFVTKYISEKTIYPCIIEKTNEFLKTEKNYKETELIENIEQLLDLADTTLKEIWNKIILKVRVLDNACGSGAFLLAAANILFDLNRQISDKLRGAENPDTTLKFLILVNNLYGVDINPNGIEIAKLRLWLWLVDSYEPEHVQPLPNIDYNLRVGNSLIGYVDVSEFKGAELTLAAWLWDEEKATLESLLKERNKLIHDYKRAEGEAAKELKNSIKQLDEQISTLLNAEFYRRFREKKIALTREEFLRLSPFHWGFEFYEVFDLGKPKEERGFDVIIGNPPYGAFFLKSDKEYLVKEYDNSSSSLDSYLLFYERSLLHLLTKGAYLGFITPNTWEQIFSAAQFRTFVLKNFNILEMVHFTRKIFKSVTVDCEIVIIQNTKRQNHKVLVTIQSERVLHQHEVPQSLWQSIRGEPFNILLTEEEYSLLKKINSKSTIADKLFLIKNGVKPFEEGKGNPPQTREIVDKKPFVSKIKQDESFRPLLRGGLIQRYVNFWNEDYWISYGPWLAAPRDPKIFMAPEKIVCRQTGDQIICTRIDNKFICRDNLHIILPRDINYNLKYILGIINSKLCDFCYRAINPEKGETFAQIKRQHLGQLPIRAIDFDNPVDEARHDRMVTLVEQMLALHEQLSKTMVEAEKAMLQKQIEETDQQIDKLVYELYGLTLEEIAIVEGKTQSK